MLASLLIVFREVLEAGLIVGIVLAATRGVPGRGRWIAGGIGAGVLGACALAAGAGQLSGLLAGTGQEVFTAGILIVAAVMLGWHTLWMARHGRALAGRMRAVGGAVAAGRTSLAALSVVVGIAVLREGAEVVLFLFGIVVGGNAGPLPLLLGGLAGVALGAALAWLLYRGLRSIPVRHLFGVTGAMVTLLAAGMAGTAAAVLARADLIASWGEALWDSSALLPESSLIGRALHALIGYADRPPGVQVAAYLVTLGALGLAGRWIGRQPARTVGPGDGGGRRARPAARGGAMSTARAVVVTGPRADA